MLKPCRYCLLFSLFLCVSLTVFGQDIYQKGRLFLQSKSSSPSEFSSGFIFSKETKRGNQLILESNDPECFIIFQSSRRDTIVAAYSTNNVFTRYKDSIVPGASGLIKAIGSVPVRNIMKTGFDEELPIGPLIESRWNQDDWYNRYCPFNIDCPAGENAWAGCIAVAMGQIIKYYGKWNEFTIDASYTHRGQNYSAYSTGYEWAHMINTPLNYELEVGKMLYHLGVLVKMNYNHQASSQSTGHARIGFNSIGYEDLYYAQRYHFNDEEWLELIKSSLMENQPVFVAGSGHAFVCDGYDEEGRLHFNLGWGGIGDGYYHHLSVAGKFSANEVIVNLTPHNEFESPHSLRIEEFNLNRQICWSPPYQWGNPTSYNIYYSDDKYINQQDTCILVNDLLPGMQSIKVSAVYPDGESIWIGPVTVYNPGEDISISDPAIRDAVKEVIETGGLLQGSSIQKEGKLANIKSLSIETPISSIEYFDYMPNIQEISINGRGLSKESLSFIENLEKLQSLKISNIDLSILPNLSNCEKLVQLSLDSCKIENLDFLSERNQLVVLEISSCEIENLNIPPGLENLEQLVLKEVHFSSTPLIKPSSNLRRLEISGAGLTDFYPDIINEKLTCIKLDNNMLESMDFVLKYPNLKILCLNGNRIPRLDLHSNHTHLEYLSISGNNIDKVSMSYDFPSITHLDLSNNKFTEFPGIFKHLPNLSSLDLSKNQISRLPLMKLLYLRELNLSHNKMVHINGIELFEALKNLNLKGNSISDLSPLIQSDNFMALNALDLSENPVSKESYLNVIPLLEENIGQFSYPPDYEGRSPCFPSPASPSKVSNREMTFSWNCEDQDENTKYDFILSIGDSLNFRQRGLRSPQFSHGLIDGQKYNWQVIAHHGDSSFYSGLYEIRTTEELELPYNEDFESYMVDQGITNASSNWRLTHGNSDDYRNADISLDNSSKGFGKSLHILSSSDVIIDLDHIDIKTMVIEFDQLVKIGASAHIRLQNINGLQIDLYLNNNQSYLYINESIQEEFDIQPNQWNHFRISIQGSNERVFIKCNDHTIFNKKWFFNNGKAQIEGIIFTSDRPGGDIQLTNFDSYIDNLAIYDANNKTGIDVIVVQEQEIIIYPNPANKKVTITGLPHDKNNLTIDILDPHGRTIHQEALNSQQESHSLATDHLPTGLYFYKLSNSRETLKSGKLLISR